MSDVPAVVDALRSVYDPCCQEKGISVVDMGLLRAVKVEDRRARVELILTSGWCPFSAYLLTTIRETVERLPGIDSASVDIVWNEVWSEARLTPEARARLRFLPDPRLVGDRQSYVTARLGRSTVDAHTEGTRP